MVYSPSRLCYATTSLPPLDPFPRQALLPLEEPTWHDLGIGPIQAEFYGPLLFYFFLFSIFCFHSALSFNRRVFAQGAGIYKVK